MRSAAQTNSESQSARGPLTDVKVLELKGYGPAPFCGMLLADMGADVLRVDRIETVTPEIDAKERYDLYSRNKRSIALDLKQPDAVAALLDLAEHADILIEPYRPGVMERLGLGPEVCALRNTKLVYGRMTGWGQEGPLASAPGHDINYIALMGALYSMGRPEDAPAPPLNLVADLGGGALYMAFGLMCALMEARRSGLGQVVDAAMVDGVASLMTGVYGYLELGRWTRQRGRNFLDGGAPYYDVYATSDDKYVAIGAVEPKFFAELTRRLGLAASELPAQNDRAGWDALRERFKQVIKSKTRAEWTDLFEGAETCFTPVLDLDEAVDHPHNQARGVYVDFAGVKQPGPAPRLTRTPASLRTAPPASGQHTREALLNWGLSPARVEAGLASGALWQKC